MTPSLDRNKLTAQLRAVVAEGHRAEPYQVIVRLSDDADRIQVAKWCHIRKPVRRRSLNLTLGMDDLASLSHQPWVKAVSLSEELISLDS